MKHHIVIWVAPLFLTGCNVPAWGNMFVLAVTLALFCATLSLGRHVTASEGEPPASAEHETIQQR